MNFLPDTNVIVNFLGGKEPDAGFLSKLLQKNYLLISVISIAEFIAGASEPDKEKFADFCRLGEIIIVNEETSQTAGEYRQQFSRKIKKAYLLDCFLAATCKKNGATLITNDLADYPMRDIKIVKPS